MKRSRKILLVILAAALLVGALALAVFASNEEKIDGRFVVAAVGYETWEEAVAAAAGTRTIYLNEDWTLDKAITITGQDTKITFNLNGHTVTIADGVTPAITVTAEANFTLEGEGTIAGPAETFVRGTGEGTIVSVDGTGDGIVFDSTLNNKDANVDIFRFDNYSTLNVKGALTANTYGVTKARTLINSDDSNKKTVTINITDANIKYAKPAVAGAPSAKLIYTRFTNLNITDSKLYVVYGCVIFSNTTGASISVGDYIEEYDATDAKGNPIVGLRWDETKLDQAKQNLSLAPAETFSIKGSQFYSKLDGYVTKRVDGDLLYFVGSTKADFEDCYFSGYARAVHGNDNGAFGASSRVANTSQLYFKNCHFFNNKEHSDNSYLFCYGPNFKIDGGSVSGFNNLANGQTHYIELTDKDGKPTGQWLGGYVDNLLGVGGLKHDTLIYTQWQNPTAYHPDSRAVTQSVTILVNGEEKTFSNGYISDPELWEKYFPSGSESVTDPVWDNVVSWSDANTVTATGDYTRRPYLDADGKTTKYEINGTWPLGAMSIGGDKGFVTSVLATNANGGKNGYVKFYWDGKTYSDATSTSAYAQFVTPDTSIASVDAFVYEWDVSTDNGYFTNTTITTQGRAKIPRFNEKGEYIGVSNLKGAQGAMEYAPKIDIQFIDDCVKFNDKTFKLSTVSGEWSRITVILDFDVSETLTEIEIPAYDDLGRTTTSTNGTVTKYFDRVEGKYVKKMAREVTKYEMHVYVNGKYFSTIAPDWSTWSDYGGAYIIDGYEANYYLDGFRFGQKAGSGPDSICFDNVRRSVYENSDNIDLGLYDENGAPKESLEGLEHFLIMINNDEIEPPKKPVPGVKVDGVSYETDEEAIAAIKDGSVIELERDMATPINVDEVLNRLNISTINLKIIPYEFSFSGVISSSHKLVDYTGAWDAYFVMPAESDEIFSAFCYDEWFGVNSDVTVGGEVLSFAEGTLLAIPESYITAFEDEIPLEGFYYRISGWLDGNGAPTANGFFADSEFQITLYSVISKTPYYFEITANGATVYSRQPSLAESLAKALESEEATVTVWQDVEIDAPSSVNGKLVLDLNGRTVTIKSDEAFVAFELLPGAEINIYSSREGARVEAGSGVTLVSTVYDRRRPSDVKVNIGNGNAENLLINCETLVDCYDTYVLPDGVAEDIYEYLNKLVLVIDGAFVTSDADSAEIRALTPIEVIASGVIYEGSAEFIESVYDDRIAVNASFTDSSFKSDSVLLDAPGKAKTVKFTNCFIDAPIAASFKVVEDERVFGGETFELGEACKTTLDAKALSENGIKIKDGCIAAYADDNGVKCYVDVPENLARVSFVDVNGELVGEVVYNAPFGNLTTDIYDAEDVGIGESNDWYDVFFAGWDVPEDLELTAGDVTVYPKWGAPEASVKCLKIDLVAYTYFKLNFYLPEELPEGVKLYGIYREADGGPQYNGDSNYIEIDGVWYKLLKTGEAELDGTDYKSYSVFPGAADAGEPEYKIVFKVGREVLVDTVKCGVPTYAETVMNNIMKNADETAGELSEDDALLASLIMNMVRYANESYKLANDAFGSRAVGAEKYEALLEKYSSLLLDFETIEFSEAEKNVDTSGLGEYMEGASFVFGEYQPKFVFKYKDSVLENLIKPETSDGRIYSWPQGNRGVFTYVYHESYDGKESLGYIAPHVAYKDGAYVYPDIVKGEWGEKTEAYAKTVDMSVRDATGVINLALYKEDGTVAYGSYSLAAYVNYLVKAAENETDATVKAEYESFKNASLSLYSFSLASQAYDYAVVNGK